MELIVNAGADLSKKDIEDNSVIEIFERNCTVYDDNAKKLKELLGGES